MTQSAQPSAWIIDADEVSFQQVAVERSRETLVVVDFWAEWCQPCRLLGPVLEKLARDYDGKFVLVKADVDRLQSIAAGFGVESIPAVYAMRDGQLLDYFVGLRSEEQLRAWLDRLLPGPAESLAVEAKKLAASDPAAAEAKYAEAIKLDPNLAAAQIGLAELLLAQGRGDESRAILEELERRGFLEPAAEKLKSQLHVMAGAHATDDLAALRTAAAEPGNLAGKLALAEALAARAEYEEALETALEVVATHRKELAEPARKLMIDVFRLLGDDSELTSTYRRRLSTALS